MRLTAVWRQQAAAAVSATTASSSSSSTRSAKTSFRSLALTVTFKNPDFNMTDYELLCRGSAFLLSVDGPIQLSSQQQASKSSGTKNQFSQQLEMEEMRRKMEALKRQHGFTPASPGGDMKDMGWLEFIPREYRPNVHIVASSHVLSPYLWNDYYPQEWLSKVKKEHCRYALDVYDGPGQSLGTFPLTDAEPYHHPEGRDVAIVHFTKEQSILPKLRKLGVQILHLRRDDDLYEKGETMSFEGYTVTGDDHLTTPPTTTTTTTTNGSDKTIMDDEQGKEEEKEGEEDTRVFLPHEQTGTLSFHANDRFFAQTPIPLPEGLCGAPAVDSQGRCCGVVEGIVPLHSEHKMIAGHAAFMPHFILSPFIQLVERQMIRAVMDESMYQMVVTAKKTNTIGGGAFKIDGEDANKKDPKYTTVDSTEEATDAMKALMKKQYSKEEYDAMMAVMAHEKEEILRLLKEEGGGDVGEITERVRAQTISIRDAVHEQYRIAIQKQGKEKQQE